jgi:hypothetical protein
MPKSWIDLVLEATDEAETPRSFIYWACISAIGAVVNNNVYLNRRGESGKIIYRLSPNTFILFIAGSGLGKGFPISLAKTMVERVDNTRVIAGRNSIQGIIRELASSTTREGKLPITDSRCYLVSGEFHNLVIKDPEALTILTEWYDTHFMGDWRNSLKGSGPALSVEKLEKLNVTMLGGSSPEHFSDTVPEVNIKGGFIGRTLLVYESKRYKDNALVMVDEPDDEAQYDCISPEIIDRLKNIASVKGRFKWTKEGKEKFEPWYYDWRKREFHDKTGTVNRITDNVLKVAMCLSLSRSLDLTLKGDDIEEAIEKCLGLSVNTKKVTEGKGSQPFAAATKSVMDWLLLAKDYTLSRKTILDRGYGDLDADDLDRVEKTLVERNAIEITRPDGKIHYTLTEAAVEQYKKFLGES